MIKNLMNYNETVNIYNQQLSQEEFAKVQLFMLENLGIKLSPIKIVMVTSRLIKRLKKTGISNFKEYLEFAMSPEGKKSGEYECMIDELTTHKTEFFREPEHFNLLREKMNCFKVPCVTNILFHCWIISSSFSGILS